MLNREVLRSCAGMGPIGVKAHLKPFLPTHPVIPTGGLPEFKGDEQARRHHLDEF